MISVIGRYANVILRDECNINLETKVFKAVN
jgi:hypothetical protein